MIAMGDGELWERSSYWFKKGGGRLRGGKKEKMCNKHNSPPGGKKTHKEGLNREVKGTKKTVSTIKKRRICYKGGGL